MTNPPIATVGGVCVVLITVLVAVPHTMLSPAPDAEEQSIQNVTVPPPAVTAGNVIATSFVTEPEAAGLMFVLLIPCLAYVVYVSSPAVAAVLASVTAEVHRPRLGVRIPVDSFGDEILNSHRVVIRVRQVRHDPSMSVRGEHVSGIRRIIGHSSFLTSSFRDPCPILSERPYPNSGP
jgi:hypothetical protein